MTDTDKILDELLAEFGSDSVTEELGLWDLLDENEPAERQLPNRRENKGHSAAEKKQVHREHAARKTERENTSLEKHSQKQKITGQDRDLQNEKRGFSAVRILVRSLMILLETVVLLLVTVYGVMFVLAKGPSVTARELFVRSVRETSAVGFLADIYLTEEEIAQIENVQEIEEFQETDTSLVTITKPTENADGPVADEWGFIDEDGDGIILDEVKGEGFSGYMMIVLDPSRVIMGSVPSSYGGRGYTVEQMVAHFDAVAGINAGGFLDPNGEGNGSIPDSLTVFEGEVYYANMGVRQGFVGLDSNHILHVGKPTVDEIKAWDIQYGASFGPVLITNGEVALPESNVGGLNPRTAIGQRSDGAILLLVIDGRQVISIGATLRDLVDIFLEYGAINACNLDGGSSTMMWFGDGYVNNCASVIGIRPVPTSFVVLKEGKQ